MSQAGNEVDAWCRKCREDHLHVICAMVDGAIAKVECKCCGSTHRFRSPHTVASTRRKAPQSERSSHGRASREELTLPPDGSLYKAYNLKTNFRVLDLIDHPKFGHGRVIRLLSQSKMEVHFGNGRKLLAHSLDAALT